MVKVIYINKYLTKKETHTLRKGIIMYTNYQKLIKDLQKKQTNKYDIRDAENLAGYILEILGYDKLKGAVPIVNIAKEFGFTVFKEKNIKNSISGNIFIGGTTKKIYNTDKVIIVGSNEEYFHQRFIIAHELAHYLMDYLGSPISNNKNLLFSKAYEKDGHDNPEEVRADRFAAELLMPAEKFCKYYIKAMKISSFNERYTIAYLSNYFETKKSSIERRINEVIF